MNVADIVSRMSYRTEQHAKLALEHRLYGEGYRYLFGEEK